jgi:hypothetical protein
MALFSSCAADPELSGHLTATLELAPALPAGSIQAVDLYLLAGHGSGGDALTCALLAGASPTTRTDLIARYHHVGPLADLHVPDLSPESQLVLAVDAYASPDATGTRIGYGCSDGITVSAGRSSPVTVLLAPAR